MGAAGHASSSGAFKVVQRTSSDLRRDAPAKKCTGALLAE